MPAPIADAAAAAEDTTATAAGQSTADDATDDRDASDEEKDWKAEYEAQQRINRSLERKTRADLKRIQALEAATSQPGADGKTATAPDPEKIRAEIRAELAKETNSERVALKAEALLAAKVNISPAAAVRLLDLSEVEVVDGKVDTEALNDAITKLLTDEPHLAVVAQGTPRFQGSADQGPRGASKSEEEQLNAQLVEANKTHNFERSIAIKQRLAALAASKAT
jgi:hypothetical protein